MKYQPTKYNNVYVTSVGHYLPGEPVDNQSMDDYIAPINKQSERIKKRILRDNGIVQRYYAIDKQGVSTHSAVEMAAHSIKQTLNHFGKPLDDVTLLATGSGGGDVLMPGLANMLQGELKASPMETRSHHGICASGVHAFKDAANLVEMNTHHNALVAAVEFPSRFFKHSRFAPMDYNVDFDAHFLRWMLSDGAGSCSLSRTKDGKDDIALKLDWIHSKSFSGDYPVCMQLGGGVNGDTSFLDTPSFSEAEEQGLMVVRQNIRLLPQLFEVAVHEYSELVKNGYIDPDSVDHFLCHYSSQKLGEEADHLMKKAGLGISRDKWYSNLSTCGNTGSASIFIMLSEFWQKKKPKPGEKVFCFVPESGRFTATYLMFTVEESQSSNAGESSAEHYIQAPHDPGSTEQQLVKQTLQELASIWHEYRSSVWRTPLVQKILNGQMDLEHYRRWMECWIPQVREGSKWMRTAISHLPPELDELCNLIETHAGEEQDDYEILFNDYLAAGGSIKQIDELQRNPGGEALNAYMYSVAKSKSSIGLLGGIYIIEGTGQRIIPVLLPKLRQQLPLTEDGFRFLRYHGENDMHHLARWLKAVSMALQVQPAEQAQSNAASIIRNAKNVANMYQLQWEYVYE